MARAIEPLRPTALEWCASASEAMRMSDCALCAREATSDSKLCVAVSVFAKQPRLFSAPYFRLAQKPPVLSGALRASVKRLAKLARKTILEISSQKMF